MKQKPIRIFVAGSDKFPKSKAQWKWCFWQEKEGNFPKGYCESEIETNNVIWEELPEKVGYAFPEHPVSCSGTIELKTKRIKKPSKEILYYPYKDGFISFILFDGEENYIIDYKYYSKTPKWANNPFIFTFTTPNGNRYFYDNNNIFYKNKKVSQEDLEFIDYFLYMIDSINKVNDDILINLYFQTIDNYKFNKIIPVALPISLIPAIDLQGVMR